MQYEVLKMLDIKIEDTINNTYLSEWNLPEDGRDMIVEIESVEEEIVKDPKKNKEDKKIVLHFKGDVKPMILSATINKKHIRQALGTGHTKEWVGKKIQLYKEYGTWFGKSGYAVRIREFAPEA